jgi:NAD(P)-dependent dehydrogenase (short-subunit alcohol dehydrogenase family)
VSGVEADLCVVVGATGAVGSAVVGRLVRRGQRVLAVARSAQALAALAQAHPSVTVCGADIADDSAIDAISSTLDSPVRMAVFAAGLPVRGSVTAIPPSDLAVAANVKLGGLLRLVRAVDPWLRQSSRIVCFAGSLGLEPRPTEAAPGAINAGVFNLMRQLGDVYGPRGVTTHTVSPGPTDTPRLRRIAANVAQERGIDEAQAWAEYAANTSLRRLPTVDEVAWAVEWLLDPQADVLHGSVLALDAGGHRGIH